MNLRANSEDDGVEFSLLEHIAAFRNTFLLSIATLIVASSFIHYHREVVISYLLAPLGDDFTNLQFLSPLDPLFFILKMDFTLGLLLSLPIIVWLVWKFITAGSSAKVWQAFLVLSITTVLATAGALYAYQVVIPIILSFMSSIVIEGTIAAYTAQGYLSFLLSTTVLLVLIFQIPLVIVLLAVLNILHPEAITERRSYIYTGILIATAVITPTTDIITLALITLPAVAVTEIGVVAARLVRRTRR